MAAQHQHYVPKLLLRGFLSCESDKAERSQVHVLDLAEDREFVTSIDNIMGERRYNDFWVDDELMATIEPMAGRIESHVAPLVERIRDTKTLNKDEEELGDLCLLMAFQFIRTRKMRDLPESLNAQVRDKVARMGLDPAKIAGLEEWDEETLKKEHSLHQLEKLSDYAMHFADKEFFLMTAPEGSSFYLGDHPVVMHSDDPRAGFPRGLGIGVPYIQIYLPLAADVLLCAYCPAVLGNLMKSQKEEEEKSQKMLLRAVQDGIMDFVEMKRLLEEARGLDLTTPLIEKIRAGEAVPVGEEQVHCYNSLQAFNATRFVVAANGDFNVTREMMVERAR